MSTYAAIIVRQYAEGRISITTDRIGGYRSNDGGYWSLWRNLLEWTGQKKSFETITIGVINNMGIPYRNQLERLAPISFQEISLNDVTYNSISKFDLLYFIGLPTASSTDLETVLETYVKDGGGLYIEVPDRDGEIEILKGIESVSCSSINRPLFGDAYWTPTGKTHYIFVDPVFVGFLVTLAVSDFSSNWIALMTNIPSDEEVPAPIITIEAKDKIGSEFGIGYTIAMQNGIVEIEPDMSTSSSSSFDSSSSSSSSSTYDNTPYNFCSNIVAYWKMDENTNNSIVWDESNNFQHMGLLKSGFSNIYTSSRHVNGILNGALSFDGVANTIETSANQTLNFDGIVNDLPFSISFWAYPVGKSGHLLCKSDVWEIYLIGSNLFMKLWSDSGYRLFYMNASPIPENKWSNITMAYDGTLGGMQMYLDGQLKSHGNVEFSYTTMKDTDSPFYFASNITSDYFEGYIDNVYVIDKVLNSIEVEVLWNSGSGTDQCEGTYVYSSTSTSSSSSESEGNTSSSSYDNRSIFEITTTGSDTLGVTHDDAVDLRIDWGDGNIEYVTGGGTVETQHVYAGAGVYTLTLQGGCTRFQFDTGADLLTDIITPINGLPDLTSFDNTFSYCQSITSLPNGLFDNCNLVTSFVNTFHNCLSLTTIPSGLFDNNSLVTSFEGVFKFCDSLSALPSGLFDNNPLVTSFKQGCSFCSSVTIPDGLFDNNVMVDDYSDTFNGCFSLLGMLPELWKVIPVASSHSGCFDGCFGAINYDNVPEDWGGPFSSSSSSSSSS